MRIDQRVPSPSPENGDGRDATIHVRLSDGEKEIARERARRKGYSLSEYVRRFLLEWEGPLGADEIEERLDMVEARVSEVEARLERRWGSG
jgi:hypothetical protein